MSKEGVVLIPEPIPFPDLLIRVAFDKKTIDTAKILW